MNRFFGFVKKEFQHIFRDVEVGIWDRSMDQATTRATQKIFSSGYFVPAGYIDHEEEIGELFRNSRARIVVVFEEGFERNLQRENRAAIKLITDA